MLVISSSRASANEVWVFPDVGSDVVLGDWGSANRNTVTFSMAVPDDFDGFAAATLVVLGENWITSDTFVSSIDAYLSVAEALKHASIHHGVELEIGWVDAEAPDLDVLMPAARAAMDGSVSMPSIPAGR